MKLKTEIAIALACLVLSTASTRAQNKYLAEAGIHGGVGLHWNRDSQGWNENFMPNLGIILRYNADDRFGLKLEWNNSSSIMETGVIGMQHIDLTGSFNFLEFEKADYKLYSSNLSPYLMTGLGYSVLNATNSGYSRETAAYLPMGLGMRAKVGKRTNLYVQAVHRFYFPVNADAYAVYPAYTLWRNNTNVMNNDQLSTLTIGMSYDFLERKCACMKDRNKKYKIRKR